MSRPRGMRETQLRALQEHWYAKAKEAGFEDIEIEGQLKRPTGDNNFIDNFAAGVDVTASFKYAEEEAFLWHPSYSRALEETARHGNGKLRAAEVDSIFRQHLKGVNYRQLGLCFNVSKNTIQRVLMSMKACMHLLEDTMEEENVKIVLRRREKTDDGFIYATWRNSLWYDNKKDDSRAPQFYKDASHYIKVMLSSPSTEVRIACRQDDADHIIGYSVLNILNLEWVYVKADYRKQGIGSLLTKGFATVTKPRTRIGASIAENKGLKVI
jgi:hypothetical protein